MILYYQSKLTTNGFSTENIVAVQIHTHIYTHSHQPLCTIYYSVYIVKWSYSRRTITVCNAENFTFCFFNYGTSDLCQSKSNSNINWNTKKCAAGLLELVEIIIFLCFMQLFIFEYDEKKMSENERNDTNFYLKLEQNFQISL